MGVVSVDTQQVPSEFSNSDAILWGFLCVCACGDRKHIVAGALAGFFLPRPIVSVCRVMEKDVLMDLGRVMTIVTRIMNVTRKIL